MYFEGITPTLALSHDSETETCFQQALDIARHQQTKSLELRAATSLARLWQSQDKRQDATDLLAPCISGFPRDLTRRT